MRRRTVLRGLGATIGASAAGCIGPSNDGDGGDSPPWFEGITVDVDRVENKLRPIVEIDPSAGVQELKLYGPNGDLAQTTVVSEGDRKLHLGQVDVQTHPPGYFGMDAGSYELSARQEGRESETEPFDFQPEFVSEEMALQRESGQGSEWVSGFQGTVTNGGFYPLLITQFGAVEGVPNPPENLPGGAEPVEAGRDPIVWPEDSLSVTEQRLGEPGPLVVPGNQASEDEARGQLEGEHSATVHYRTPFGAVPLAVDFELSGDLVTFEQGYAMSDGEVLDATVESEPTWET